MLIQSMAKKDLYFNILQGGIALTLMKATVSFPKQILLSFRITATGPATDK